MYVYKETVPTKKDLERIVCKWNDDISMLAIAIGRTVDNRLTCFSYYRKFAKT